MSIATYYLSHLRLLAARHGWPQVADASAALNAAVLAGESAQIEHALAQLENSLFVTPPAGPHQTLRQAREHYHVLSRIGLTTSPAA